MLEGGRHLCIAAGSGITPMLSVASSRAVASDGDVTLLYGNWTTGSVMFAEELADLKNRYGPQLQLVHVLSREPRDVELFSGRLDSDRLRQLLDRAGAGSESTTCWLCGPHADAARRPVGPVRARRTARAGALRAVLRRRAATGAAPAGSRCAAVRPPRSPWCWTGCTTTAALPREQSILDGAQTAAAPTCRSRARAVSRHCRARVIEGEVDMRRNYALEDAEVEDGFVLTCQSHPLGDRVTVDYDA